MSTVWFSLRRRLLGLLLGGVSLAWLATVAFSYVDAHHEIDALFDAQMAQSAQALLLLGDVSGAPPEAMAELVHRYQRRLRFQVWDERGRLLSRSANAPAAPLTEVEGFSETRDDTGHWRHFSQWSRDGQRQVQVSEDHQFRDELIGQIAWRLLMPALFGLPLLGLGVWLATRRGMAVLDVVTAQIAARAPHQLQAVAPASAPEEVRPMLEALNDLLARVESALQRERRFTADAAHELRTPLAALQVQLALAQSAQSSHSEAEGAAALEVLRAGLVRAAHLVDQMLQLARLDPEAGVPAQQAVDLGKLAEAVCADLGSAILARDLDFSLDCLPAPAVDGHPEWLRILLRNLVDNAIRYTPPGGRLSVQIAPQAGAGAMLTVCDSGPGIPPEERERVLRRFYRLAEAGRTAEGSGLGLSIVARIAELHGARLQLESPLCGPGLQVRVIFPGGLVH